MTSSEIKFVPKVGDTKSGLSILMSIVVVSSFFEEGKEDAPGITTRLKDETFYLNLVNFFCTMETLIVLKVQRILFLYQEISFIYRGLRHQMIAIEPSELFEFSTQHFDEDSYRVLKETEMSFDIKLMEGNHRGFLSTSSLF